MPGGAACLTAGRRLHAMMEVPVPHNETPGRVEARARLLRLYQSAMNIHDSVS